MILNLQNTIYKAFNESGFIPCKAYLDTISKIEMFSNTEDLLPVISFNAKASAEDKRKHEDFVARMVDKGYTAKQVRLLCDWYLRVRKSS